MNAPLTPDSSHALQQALDRVTLDDKYSIEHGRAFMSGVQALVRLPMMQRTRTEAMACTSTDTRNRSRSERAL